MDPGSLLFMALSLGYAWISYCSFAEWKGLRTRLQVYADKDFSPSAAVPAEGTADMEEAVSKLIDDHGLTLLSWHQARPGRRTDPDDGRDFCLDPVVAQ